MHHIVSSDAHSIQNLNDLSRYENTANNFGYKLSIYKFAKNYKKVVDKLIIYNIGHMFPILKSRLLFQIAEYINAMQNIII